MIIPTAISTTFPRIANCLNSLIMFILLFFGYRYKLRSVKQLTNLITVCLIAKSKKKNKIKHGEIYVSPDFYYIINIIHMLVL